MASVTHLEHADGSHSVGVKIDGSFVPFLTLSGARVAQLLENSANQSAAEPEPEAEEAE